VSGLQIRRIHDLDSYKSSVLKLIERVIGDYHDPNDFLIVFDSKLNEDDQKDTFEVCLMILLEFKKIMVNKTKLIYLATNNR